MNRKRRLSAAERQYRRQTLWGYFLITASLAIVGGMLALAAWADQAARGIL
jgi:hypothetical protein